MKKSVIIAIIVLVLVLLAGLFFLFSDRQQFNYGFGSDIYGAASFEGADATPPDANPFDDTNPFSYENPLGGEQ